MSRRSLPLLVLMGLSMSWLTGCDRFRQMLRSSDSVTKSEMPEEHDPTSPTKIQAVDADTKHPKPFFSKYNGAGGWSSEAREIEGHLGVGP